MTSEERFWSKVEKTEGCWLWVRARTAAGYGHFYILRQHHYAHRFSYELAHGPIPTGLIVCHRCDNPQCVRPEHLFLGTDADNSRDKWSKGRGVAPTGERSGSRRHPEQRPRGESAVLSKLTEDAVRAIRARADEPRHALAAEFGVSVPTICHVIARRSWRHV